MNRTKEQYRTVVKEWGELLFAVLIAVVVTVWLTIQHETYKWWWYAAAWIPYWGVLLIQKDRKQHRQEELETAKRINAKCKQCEHEFEIVLYPPKKKHRCEVCNAADFSVVDSMPITDDQEPDPPS